MDNLFVKEVINGKLVEMEQFNVLKLLQVTIKLNETLKESDGAERMLYLICSVLKIDGKRVGFDELANSTDFEVFDFISESFNAMTNNNLI